MSRLAPLVAVALALASCQTAQSPEPAVDKSVRPTVHVWLPEGYTGGPTPPWVTVDVQVDGWWWSYTPVSAGDADQRAEGEAEAVLEGLRP